MQLKIEVQFTVRLLPWTCIVYNQYIFYCLVPSVYCLSSIVYCRCSIISSTLDPSSADAAFQSGPVQGA